MLERSERAIGVTMQENNISSVTGIALGEDGTPDIEGELAADGGESTAMTRGSSDESDGGGRGRPAEESEDAG
jgi:hypothetical protein